MEMPPEMVLFDCDGVLVDSEPLTNDVLRANLARYGLAISTKQFVELFVGGTIAGIKSQAQGMGAKLPADWIDEAYAEMFAVLSDKVELIPGVSAVLDLLDEVGIVYAIGSNGPHRKMEITLTRTGIASRFNGRVWSREDVAAPKPAPDIYLHAAAHAGIVPSRCAVIEDSPSGARAAKAAGIYCLGYAADTDPARLADICDVVFDDMAALPGLIGLPTGR